MKHKLPTRIQQWLKDLTDKEYLIQFYDKDSFVNKTKPAVYCLHYKARKILKTQKKCDPNILSNLYREKTRSPKFQIHCNDIAKISDRLEKQAEEQGKTCKFWTKVELNGYTSLPQPPADAYFTLSKRGMKTRRYLLELFDEKIPKRFIKSKVRRYITSAEGAWKENIEVAFPVVLLVAQNPYEQKKITRCTRIVMDDEYGDVSFYITTKEKLLAKELPKKVWQEIVSD